MNCGIQVLVLLGLCGVWIQQGYGLTCYSCNGGNSNNRCKRNTIECDDGQSCFASVQITGTGQVQSVRKQCVNRCATRRRRSCRSPGCSYCCSTDLCNGGLSTPSRIPEEDDTDTDNAGDRSNSVAFSARGIYVFHVTSVAARSNTVATPLLLLKNDVAVLETGTFDGIASPSFHVGLGHVTLQLEMGDVIRLVTVPYGGLVLGSLSSPSEVTFTGFRLSSN